MLSVAPVRIEDEDVTAFEGEFDRSTKLQTNKQTAEAIGGVKCSRIVNLGRASTIALADDAAGRLVSETDWR